MHKMIYMIGAAAIAALALTGSTKSSEAEIIYPWCAHYGGKGMGGAPNCGFTSYPQCMATVSGTGGWCGVNPWYEPPLERRPRRGPAGY